MCYVKYMQTHAYVSYIAYIQKVKSERSAVYNAMLSSSVDNKKGMKILQKWK